MMKIHERESWESGDAGEKASPARFGTLALVLAAALCSCIKHEPAPQIAKRPLFYKEGVTDKQMTRDLNQCAREAFKNDPDSGGPKKECMQSRGYEIFYN